MPFAHLEVHSHYTLLGATPSVTDLAARAAADGMAHLALTDCGALYGAVAFANACRAEKVTPLIGMTLNVTDPLRDALTDPGKNPEPPGRLVLIADGPAGYRSLCRLSSLIQSSPDREILAARGPDWATLAEHRAGLFAFHGGKDGWVERFLRTGQRAAAYESAKRLAGIFDDRARLALEIHEPGDAAIADEVVALGRRLGVETVAVHPIYYLAPGDAPRLRLLEAIRRNIPLSQLPDDATPPDGSWLRADEMAARYARFPAALDATAALAEACRPCLPDGGRIWPDLHLPAGVSADAALAAQAEKGLCTRYGTDPNAAIRARLERELAAISDHACAPLFLVVADIVHHSRQSGIPVATRGSVANSLVAYAVGITTVDPIEHDLLFERFLNPARADIPDIDLDFCSRRRDEVLAYVRDTYGPEHVAIIGTISTMQPQSAVREVGKALELSTQEIDRLAAAVPHHWHPDPRRRDRRTLEDVAATLNDPRHQQAMRAAAGLVGQPDHLSLHPGGVVVTPGPLTDWLPTQWAPKGFLSTQYEHTDVEALGLPKMDLLGIRALTVLADAVALVRLHHDPGFSLEDLPLDDATTAALLARGETIGVFQCESEGAQTTLRKLRASTVRDLAVANAFFKPGPAMGGMASAFVRRYRGEERVSYLHPTLEVILGPTQGVLLFQEQILRVAREIAGLSWEQADQLRKGMSHFGVGQMTALRDQFVAGCQRQPPDGPGLIAPQAATLWEQVVAFAGYGFNQGHATAYADVSYRSAYLKTHWPAAFLCARLADHGGFHHPTIYIAEAQRLGIVVRPPHVNHSGPAFTYAPGTGRAILWMGLGQVRDLRQRAVEEIIAARGSRPFVSLHDLITRTTLQQREILHLIRSGALDGLGLSRHVLQDEASTAHRAHRRARAPDQLPLLPTEEETVPAASTSPDGLARPDAAQLRDYLQWEKQLLGFPVSAHPLALFHEQLPVHTPLEQIGLVRNRAVTTAGARLPGWTGGNSFFLGNGVTFVTVRVHRESSLRPPAPWQPVLVEGRWQQDQYGSHWLLAERITEVGPSFDAP